MTQDFILDDTRYYARLRPYIDFYGLEHIHVLSLEALLQDHVGTWTALCRFLEIEPILIEIKSENVSGNRQRLPKSIAFLRSGLNTTGISKLVPQGAKQRVLSWMGRSVPPQTIDGDLGTYILEALAEDLNQFRSLFPHIPDYLANQVLLQT